MTVLYVDTSALLKRVFIEPESERVREVLRATNAAGDLLTSSALTWVELHRALRRAGGANAAAAARRAMRGIAEYPLADGTLSHARHVGDPTLRTLDAI